jgi:heat shock protein HtpX
MLIVIDILFYSMIFGRRDDRRSNGNNQIVMVILILRYVLPVLTVVLTLFLSRTREFMADSGAVELMRDNEPMARALLKISKDHQEHADEYANEYGNTAHEQIRQASYLFDPSNFNPAKSFTNAFSTHPAIEERLKSIGFIRKDQ